MIMGWMMDEYSKIRRERTPDVITGKPIPLGGSLGRDDATGRGAYYCVKELEKLKSWNPLDIRVAVQGFGNAGQHVARLLQADGYKIVAISDSGGGILRDDGIDIVRAIKRKRQRRTVSEVYSSGSVCDCPECGCIGCRCATEDQSTGDLITNEQLLELNVDILIPAALENQITSENAGRIRARYIIEVANGPTTSAADEILSSSGSLIVPDILANAGGVTVSYFEWAQNRAGFYWTEDEVYERLERIMSRAFGEVYQLMTDGSIPMRTAAYALALDRIGDAIESQGTSSYFSESKRSL